MAELAKTEQSTPTSFSTVDYCGIDSASFWYTECFRNLTIDLSFDFEFWIELSIQFGHHRDTFEDLVNTYSTFQQ